LPGFLQPQRFAGAAAIDTIRAVCGARAADSEAEATFRNHRQRLLSCSCRPEATTTKVVQRSAARGEAASMAATPMSNAGSANVAPLLLPASDMEVPRKKRSETRRVPRRQLQASIKWPPVTKQPASCTRHARETYRGPRDVGALKTAVCGRKRTEGCFQLDIRCIQSLGPRQNTLHHFIRASSADNWFIQGIVYFYWRPHCS
jgi:hypothetical protein